MTSRGRSSTRTVPPWATALKVRRVQLGISQEGVADLTNGVVSQSTMSALEVGRQELTDLAYMRVVALARALSWSLGEMQRATGVDLGIAEVNLVGEGSADVYPLSAALSPNNPGAAIDHVAVTPGVSRPLLLRADTDEMQGTSRASVRPGSYLHLDLDLTTPAEGLVYVITDHEGVHLRLYTTTRLGAVFRAENREHEDIPASEAQVIGQVMAVTTDYSPDLN